MVEYLESVAQWRAGVSQVAPRRDDAARREIAMRVVVTANDHDARMVAAGLHNQVVQRFEVVVIAG